MHFVITQKITVFIKWECSKWNPCGKANTKWLQKVPGWSEYSTIMAGRLEPTCASAHPLTQHNCSVADPVSSRRECSAWKVSKWGNQLPQAVGKHHTFPVITKISDRNTDVSAGI
jgi:hypothetical protein